MNAADLKPTLERTLGVPIKRCRMGVGSMRQFVFVCVAAPFPALPASADEKARQRQWFAERLGFSPFCTSRYGGNLDANISLDRLLATKEATP
jgi:hypothetical protein